MLKRNEIVVWVKAPCDKNVREKLITKFDKCSFVFGTDDIDFSLKSAEIIIGEPSEKEILQAENLKWIQLTFAGADKYVKMKDILSNVAVTNASGAFGRIISEYVIGMVISMYRSFPKYWRNQNHHIWQKNYSSDTIFGKKVLILGTGDIGKNIAIRLKVFGACVNGIRKTTSASSITGFDNIYDLSSLDELITDSDIIIGCLPDTHETRGLITYSRLKAMKKDTVLINVGRGNLIHTDDLIKVLKSGHLKGVVLDVFENEPLPDSSPLWNMENVIITPHIAGPSFGGNADVENLIWNICFENIERYLNGDELKNTVNFFEGY